MDRAGAARKWLRQNVLGLVAIFIALSGSAVAANVADEGGSRSAPAADPAKASKKSKRGPRGPAGPQGPQGPQGLQGIQGPVGPATGPAGGDLAGNYPNPTLKPPEDWIEVNGLGGPGLNNGWTDAGAPTATAAFYKDPRGIVRLRGTIKGGTVTLPAFTLPGGYAPESILNFAGIVTSGTPAALWIQIVPNGDVVVQNGILAPGDGIALDGITFRACGAPGTTESC